MEITIQDQENSDFDWFCVDDRGEIGHFTTAGYKLLPASVAQSAEELKLVADYFEDCPVRGGHRVDEVLAEEWPDPKDREDRYFKGFIAMADRGLYSFDIKSYLKPNISYFRVASPEHPLQIAELPAWAQQIVKRTVLRDLLLNTTSRIPYELTLSM